MKKLYFIANPVAGEAKISAKLGEIIDEFVKAGYEVTVHTTQNSNDAVKHAHYACKNDFDVLACAGGDGTLSQCLQGIMNSERRIPLGYIPAGTTNDFARNLFIPREPMSAVKYINSASTVLLDVCGFNNDYFSYIAAFGAFTDIAYKTPQKFKNVFGHAAYIANGAAQLTNITSKRMRIEFDGQTIEDDFVYGMVTNTASVAGFLTMKNFYLDDGVFEVTLIRRPKTPADWGTTAIAMLKNDNSDKNIVFFRTNKAVFTCLAPEPAEWTRDGEYAGALPVNTVVCNKRAVPFLVIDRDELPICENTKEAAE